eukprot:8839502-Pyramimonas_sp.AAC.1
MLEPEPAATRRATLGQKLARTRQKLATPQSDVAKKEQAVKLSQVFLSQSREKIKATQIASRSRRARLGCAAPLPPAAPPPEMGNLGKFKLLEESLASAPPEARHIVALELFA